MCTTPEALIIADDYTGALDSAVQFAKRGYPALAYTAGAYTAGAAEELHAGAGVAAYSTDTRHADAACAYRRVHALAVAGVQAGARLLYKKTDSVLRGNIGSELDALMDAAGQKTLPYLPAYPALGRTTRRGLQYVNGKPLADTELGRDIFSEVRDSSVIACVRGQSRRQVSLLPAKGDWGSASRAEGIVVCDAEEEADIRAIVAQLQHGPPPIIAAGSAGMAEYLPQLLWQPPQNTSASWRRAPLLIVSGSLNPVAVSQIRLLEAAGLPLFRASLRETHAEQAAQEIAMALRRQGAAVLSTDYDAAKETETLAGGPKARRAEFCEFLGGIAALVLRQLPEYALMVVGGDTLQELADRLFGGRLQPLRAPLPGAVWAEGRLADGKVVSLLTKSGGFGGADTLLRMVEAFHFGTNDITFQ